LELICIFSDNWFTVDEKPPIAHTKVEILEGADMKPSDTNGIFSTSKIDLTLFPENASYLDNYW
jgi:hypothetical protein